MKNVNYPIKERNNQLLAFMKSKLNNDIKLIGNPNQPKIILDNTYAISGFVKNRIYNFTTKPFGGEITLSVNLNKKDEYSPDEIKKEVDKNEKRKIFICELTHTNGIYISHTKNGNVYFSIEDPRIFFNRDDAQSFSEHIEKSYNLHSNIICPLENIF